jgi:hypothetical protein
MVLTHGVLFSQASSSIEVSYEKFKLRENDYVDKTRNLKLSDQKSVSKSFGSIYFWLIYMNKKKLGKFIVCGNIYDEITSNCYLTFESYELSAFGFKKSNFHKKIKTECAG